MVSLDRRLRRAAPTTRIWSLDIAPRDGLAQKLSRRVAHRVGDLSDALTCHTQTPRYFWKKLVVLRVAMSRGGLPTGPAGCCHLRVLHRAHRPGGSHSIECRGAGTIATPISTMRSDGH